ncbi:hypothetical protein EJ070_33105 [Mesorhizobium sp. M1E.F.Ca.ET.045.02.1.1]|nr:hypothetical protein EJ070_33105 [Mesorhizobium sp. M1E.F.Ca.ET.045.02.1.1]TKB17621.1 MAG: hypothetical protein E5V75_11520 [Mesorhizobium sp.]
MKGQLAKTQNAETVARWAEALDALDSVLPFDRRGFLAELLTDDDVSVRLAPNPCGKPGTNEPRR